MKPMTSPQDQEIIKLLGFMRSDEADYPPELLAKRRAAFMSQVGLLEKAGVKDPRSMGNKDIVEILKGLRSVEAEYPSILMAKQRTAFLNRSVKQRRLGWVEAFHAAIRGRFSSNARIPAEMAYSG